MFKRMRLTNEECLARISEEVMQQFRNERKQSKFFKFLENTEEKQRTDCSGLKDGQSGQQRDVLDENSIKVEERREGLQEEEQFREDFEEERYSLSQYKAANANKKRGSNGVGVCDEKRVKRHCT